MKEYIYTHTHTLKGDEAKYHLVKDFAVCQPIQLGGLGARSLQISNIALLGKWLWRFSGETDTLW